MIKVKQNILQDSILLSLPDKYPPLIKRLLAARPADAGNEDLLLRDIIPVSDFIEIYEAIPLLSSHYNNEILIYGDYDVDGATSISLLFLGLKDLNFSNVKYYVPNRMTMGYGFSLLGLEDLLKDHKPRLIITVDNGMSSFDAVEVARKKGIDILIVDHHLEGPRRPSANVIVNPNLNNTSFSGKNLAAVGVVFYLLSALGKELDVKNVALNYCDLVALGTVADMVKLDKTNRTLIKYGLNLIKQKKCRPGILYLFEALNKNIEIANEDDLGFLIAPRINAAGRIDDMRVGIECLISNDSAKLKQTTGQLNSINYERKKMQLEMSDEADELIKKISNDDLIQPIIILRGEHWHEGVIGLIASRIKERYGKPTLIFSRGNEIISASARSVPGFHLRDFLIEVDRIHPGLMVKFGGHAMAAGLSIKTDQFERIRGIFYDVAKSYSPNKIHYSIYHDGALTDDELCLETIEWYEKLSPWGKDFEYPTYYQEFYIANYKWLQGKHFKCALRMKEGKKLFQAIAFNQEHFIVEPNSIYNILYVPKKNYFNDNVTLQLLIQHNTINKA
jgi:single-stranded-DNA-specific exonuclease